MKLEQVVELEKMAKAYKRLYESTGLCGISGLFGGPPEVHLNAREFFKTFGNLEYEYTGEPGHEKAVFMFNGVRFFTLLSGYTVREVLE